MVNSLTALLIALHLSAHYSNPLPMNIRRELLADYGIVARPFQDPTTNDIERFGSRCVGRESQFPKRQEHAPTLGWSTENPPKVNTVCSSQLSNPQIHTLDCTTKRAGSWHSIRYGYPFLRSGVIVLVPNIYHPQHRHERQRPLQHGEGVAGMDERSPFPSPAWGFGKGDLDGFAFTFGAYECSHFSLRALQATVTSCS